MTILRFVSDLLKLGALACDSPTVAEHPIDTAQRQWSDWFQRCWVEGDYELIDTYLDPIEAVHVETYRIPDDRFDRRHPERVYYCLMDVSSDGHYHKHGEHWEEG